MTSEHLLHIAFTVPDLEAAEAYYTELFDMQLITREAPGPGGGWQLPHDKDWSDARQAGIQLYMLALRRGDMVLALFDETSPVVSERSAPVRPFIVGLQMDPDEIARVCARLGSDETIRTQAGGGDGRCEFRDRYGIVWQVKPHGEFVGNGDGSDRWLEL